MIQKPLQKEDKIPFSVALGYWSPNFYLPVKFVCKRKRTLIISVLQKAHCCFMRLARWHWQLWKPRCICGSWHSHVRAWIPMTITREIRKAIHSVFPKKKNKNHDLKVGRSCKNNLKKYIIKNTCQCVRMTRAMVWCLWCCFDSLLHSFGNLCVSYSIYFNKMLGKSCRPACLKNNDKKNSYPYSV